MKKSTKGTKGFTLLEVLLAVFIFSVVALPLLSLYLQAVKTDVAARNVLNANYIAQDYIEKLDTATYPQALASLPLKEQAGDYYLSASIAPHGSAGNLFSASFVYAHLLLLEDGKMLAVMPDGKWQLYAAIPAQISLSVSAGSYTLSCDGSTLSGTAAYSYCVLVVNAMKMPPGASPTLNLGEGCKAVVYCTDANASSVILAGDGVKHKNVIAGHTSLVHVTASVYDQAGASAPVAQSEAYISIRNWS